MSSPTDRNEPPHGPDGLDGWLNAPVEPLLPPPGTYEKIVRRARRRRLNRALSATAAVAAVVVAAAFVPQLNGLLTAQGVRAAPPVSPSRSPHSQQKGVTPRSPAAPQATGAAGPLAAPDFTPASVTFIGLQTGWALGRHAAPCPENGCTALARTDDTGQHWHSVPAPDGGPPDGGGGVSQVRFLNRADGWVFGPQLWATHDGGQTWEPVSTGGQRVISLEATGDRVFAVFARCSGTGSGWNTGCSSYQLHSAAAAGGAWAAVPGGSGQGRASLVLTSRTGYLLAQNGGSVTVSSGPADGGAPWTRGAPVPCGQPSAGPSAQPSGMPSTPAPSSGPTPGSTAAAAPAALLAAASPSDLFLLCSAGAGTGAEAKTAYLSADGGQQWRQGGPVPAAGTATSVAAAGPAPGGGTSGSSGTAGSGVSSPGGGSGNSASGNSASGNSPSGTGTLLIATGSGIYVSRDGGATWQMPLQVPDGGIGYVGMTDASQGFAVPAGQEAIWFTADGGQSWHQSAI